jgi:sodium/potassium/calcium exchanger 1
MGIYAVAIMIGHFSSYRHFMGLRRLTAAADDTLDDKDDEDDCIEKPGVGPVFGWIFLILYMFLAIAIVCDEFFVPCLEYIADDFHLSKDVAGATLMAAGGSAPELFMSVYGTFRETSVGFSTIVGSAVFNVIFVIGVCALAAPSELELTWWPLFRDSIYYLISLCLLTTFFGGTSPNEIKWWEALILFCLYILYVLMMGQNMKIYKWVMMKFLHKTEEEADEIVRLQDPEQHVHLAENKGQFFRAGILGLLTKDKDIGETAALMTVSDIKGDALDTFAEIDKDNDGHITENEFAELLKATTGIHQSPEMVKKIFETIDINKNGRIDKSEFEGWYRSAEAKLEASVREAFGQIDDDNSGSINATKIVKVLESLGQKVEKKKRKLIMEQVGKEDGDELTYQEFAKWYKSSLFWRHTQGRRMTQELTSPVDIEESNAPVGLSDVAVEADGDGEEDGNESIWTPPAGASPFALFMWFLSLPLVVLFTFTIPLPPEDDDKERTFFVKTFGPLPAAFMGFVVAIAWIGVSTGGLAYAAELTCRQFGIPTVVSGLTFLAAGTSVPDLLSSVIVTKQGQGDMAVSSSIGSNIFDVLVGLPFPWLLYTIAKGKAVNVGAENLIWSITMLIAMLLLVICSVAYLGWKLTKPLGATMFALYAVFLGVMLGISTWGGC